jgi:hypothetical protein
MSLQDHALTQRINECAQQQKRSLLHTLHRHQLATAAAPLLQRSTGDSVPAALSGMTARNAHASCDPAPKLLHLQCLLRMPQLLQKTLHNCAAAAAAVQIARSAAHAALGGCHV